MNALLGLQVKQVGRIKREMKTKNKNDKRPRLQPTNPMRVANADGV
jgi:hypothetical protein